MNKYIRYGIRVLAWTLGVILVLWLILWVFIALNTKTLKNTLLTEIRERTKGDVMIGDVSPSFFRTFPFISMELENVIIRDSMYSQHKHDFFSAKNIYLRVSPLSLLSKKRVGRIILKNGTIHILTDTSGYSNNYILKTTEPPEKRSAEPDSYPDIELVGMKIIFENPLRNKFHQAEIHKLVCGIDKRQTGLLIDIDAQILVQSLAFNTTKGSYIKNHSFDGDFEIKYDKKERKISFSDILIKLNDHPFRFTGNFSTNPISPDFNLSISTRDVNFTHAANILPDSVNKKLNLYSLEKPVDISVDIVGQTVYKSKPRVLARMDVSENTLKTSFGTITDCNFKGEFTNEVDPAMARLDENSRIQVFTFSGKLGDIPIQSKAVKITNLKQPYLECDIISDFDLKALNELTGSSTLLFTQGKTHIDVQFNGPIGGTDSVKSDITGNVQLSEAAFTYIPRNINFTNGNGVIQFNGKDLLVRKLNVQTGKSTLLMNGDAENFLSILNISPEKLTLHWNIFSPQLHLGDYKGFLSKPVSQATQRSDKALFQKTAGKIDKMFTDGDVFLSLEASKMNYNKFSATDVKADIVLTSTQVSLQKVSLNHANGTMNLKGTMKDVGAYNEVDLTTEMVKLNIPLLFNAFNDFGQDAITQKNLKGQISAKIILTTGITDKASILREKTSGTIDFLIENGELNHFEPLEKISQTAFKKQDFSEIAFADLKNKLTVNGTAFVIDRMEIRSSALTMFVEGIYDVKNGTDMSIQLPVRNLTKSQANTDLTEEGKKGAGFAIRLRAKTGEEGKLNVSWDPFKRALKNKEEKVDSIKSN